MRLQRRRLDGMEYVVRLDDEDHVTHAATTLTGALGGPAVPRELLLRLQGPHHELLPPATPSKIVCVGLNYRAHAEEMGKPLPEEPLLFLKPPSAVLAPEGEIELPPESHDVQHEGELAVVIGRRARRVSVDDAQDYVLGLTLLNDVTARDIQRREQKYTRAKGFDTFAPLGPTIVAGLQPSRLTLETRVNGAVRQRSGVDDLIFSVPELVSFVSQIMTLEPGDVISTGTPSGVGVLVPGDVVEVEIPEIGLLRNRVVEA